MNVSISVLDIFYFFFIIHRRLQNWLQYRNNELNVNNKTLLSTFDHATDEILNSILNSNELFNLHEFIYMFHFLLLLNWLQNWLQSRNNIAANSKFKLTRSNFNHELNNRSRLSSSSESSLSSASSSSSSSSFSFSFSKKSHNKQFVEKMLWKQSIMKLRIDDRKMKFIKVSLYYECVRVN